MRWIQNHYYGNGGATGTDEKYKDTWATYDEAYVAMQKCGASGLGFKIPEDVYFLDIDHREMSDPLLQKLLNRYNSYTEYSPSGNGIHILGTCDSRKVPIVYDEKKKRHVLSGEYIRRIPATEWNFISEVSQTDLLLAQVMLSVTYLLRSGRLRFMAHYRRT